ncbi:MAG: hypothetical protein ABJF10_26300 [Chthoniobacter sp.]|uniref:hypothetical protein n=1 Tax=Chthoniobacter sp. TaxID=2510640 RepID=UPI0032A72849
MNDDDLIVLEGRRVCPACKPLVVQQLKEGCLPPMPSALPIELAEYEFGYWELIKKTWSICRQDWPAIVGLQLLVSLPSELLVAMASTGDDEHMRPSWRMTQYLDSFVGVVAVLGIAWVVNERVQGRSLSFVEALKKAVPRWLPAIGTNLVMGLIVVLWALALIVPGIVYLGYYTFAVYVVALRGRASTHALNYSKGLVKGRWWRVVGKMVGLFLPPIVPMFIIAVPLAFLPQSQFVEIFRETLNDLLLSFCQVGGALLFLNLDAVERKTPLSAITLSGVGSREPGQMGTSAT